MPQISFVNLHLCFSQLWPYTMVYSRPNIQSYMYMFQYIHTLQYCEFSDPPSENPTSWYNSDFEIYATEIQWVKKRVLQYNFTHILITSVNSKNWNIIDSSAHEEFCFVSGL